MRIAEFEPDLKLGAPTVGYVRSKGLHASDLYGAYYKALDPKRYDKRDAKGDPVPMDMAKIELGTAFEEILEPALASRLLGSRPGEFEAPHADWCKQPNRTCTPFDVCPECAAGVLFSPDALFEIGRELVLGEFKCTYYSTRGAPTDEKFAKWISQVCMYGYWLNIPKVRLYAMFLCGDYKPPSPVLKGWTLTFTRKEQSDETRRILTFCQKKGLLKAA